MTLTPLAASPLAAATSGAADFSHDTWWIVLIKAVAVIVFLLLSVLFAIWFERRVVARMQLRPGPNVHGPFGLLQSLADAMKLLFKEDLTVRAADKVIYILAPMISVFASLLVFAVIPMGPAVSIFGHVTPLQLTDFPVAVLYILAAASIGVYGIVLGGWASGSTYPLLGSVRSTAQVISYELAMGMSLVSVFIVTGSMSTSEIVAAQDGRWLAFNVATILPFLLYIVAMVGETNRLPFDLPEAEGELVGGYMTEYSSMKFAWFFLAEYINMLNVSAVATTLFLGGWHAPFPINLWAGANSGWWPVLWFLLKLWFFMFVFVWLRGTLLRLRYDQFMKFGWKILIPLALATIVFTSVTQTVRLSLAGGVRTAIMAVAVVAFVVALVGYFVPEKPKPKAEAETEPEVIDAFAAGYPVPPLPGQVLPPSPRAGRRAVTVDATVATADAPATSQEETRA